MKLFALRAADYLRSASDNDRRYLLYNPIVKMKVTGQGEQVVGMLHDVIAAKGFEQDTYFEMAIRDIGMLPKLEGTEHVNMALIIKFVRNYFFDPVDHPVLPRCDGAVDDSYLFRQQTGGLSKVRFPDYLRSYANIELPNVLLFCEQLELFRRLLLEAPPNKEQSANIDYMLAAGELFTLIAYAQLILENSQIYTVDDDLLDQIFTFLVKDFSGFALRMLLDHGNSTAQQELFRQMIKQPQLDDARFEQVWNEQVLVLRDCYEMGA